jgi:broad-specificity NMP kinase
MINGAFGVGKTTVASKLLEIIRLKYQRNLIVPMTIYNKDNFSYIYDGLKEIDNETRHFCLMAAEETIYERLRKRGEVEGNWCFQQTKNA